MTKRLAKDRLSTDLPGLLFLLRIGCGESRFYSRSPSQTDCAMTGMSIHVYV